MKFIYLAAAVMLVLLPALYNCSGFFDDPELLMGSYVIGKGEEPRPDSETIGQIWNKNAGATNITQEHAGTSIGWAIADPVVLKLKGTYHLWYTAISKVNGSDFYAIRYAWSDDGISWIYHGASSIVLAPTEGSLSHDAGGLRVGSVLWDDEEREFKMWYRGIDSAEAGGGTWRILFARSRSAGEGWIKSPNTYESTVENAPRAIIEPGAEFDSDELGDLSVIKQKYYDGYRYFRCYKMWYVGKGAKAGTGPDTDSEEKNKVKYRIMYASSGDGIEWEKPGYPGLAPLPDTFNFSKKISPTVIYDRQGTSFTYKMWYIGGDKDRLGLAYSFSGDIFDYPSTNPDRYTPEEGLLTFPYKGTIKDPWVLRDGLVYKMWYVVDDIDEMNNPRSVLHYVESW